MSEGYDIWCENWSSHVRDNNGLCLYVMYFVHILRYSVLHAVNNCISYYHKNEFTSHNLMQVQLILQCHKLEDIKISIKFDFTKKVTLLFKILYGETKIKTTLSSIPSLVIFYWISKYQILKVSRRCYMKLWKIKQFSVIIYFL